MTSPPVSEQRKMSQQRTRFFLLVIVHRPEEFLEVAKLTSDVGIVDSIPAGPEHEPIFRQAESCGKDNGLSSFRRGATIHG